MRLLQGYLGMKTQLTFVGSINFPPPDYSRSLFEVRSVASGDLPLQTRSNAPSSKPIKHPQFKPDQTPPIQTRSNAPESVHEWI